MKLRLLLQFFLLLGSFWSLLTHFANAEERQISSQTNSAIASINQQSSLLSAGQPIEPTREIRQLSEVNLPLKSADTLVQSPTLNSPPANEIIEVTSVKVNGTDKGVEVILVTSKGQQLQVSNRNEGNSFVADIPNAQLRLPNGDAFTFRSQKPVVGISEITVINQDSNTIRLTVTGETGVPSVELFDSDEGLIFGLKTVASSAQTPPTPPQPENQTPSEKPSGQTDEPIELVVTGEQDGYRVPNATSATRTDTPIRDIPASIQVIPQQVIKDQQATRLDEALRNVSGVTFAGNNDNRGIRFSLRGFGAQAYSGSVPVLRDGFRVYGSQGFPELSNLERVEVLKGPASILYGEIDPGGVVNLVSKQPLAEPFFEAELQVGSQPFVRPRFDISGPLTTDGKVLYRLNALYQYSESFRNYDNNLDHFSIAPIVTWKIDDRTNLTFNLEYTKDRGPADFGIVASNDGIVNVPRTRVSNNPNDTIENTYLSVGYNLEHKFSDNWTIRNAFRYLYYSYDYSPLALPLSFDGTTGLLTRYFADQDDTIKDYSLQTNVVGKLTTGSIKHNLVVGVDLNNSDESATTKFGFGNPNTINIFNPVYSPEPDPSTLAVLSNTSTNTKRLGVYAQDQVTLLDNLFLLAGFRYDTVDQTVTNNRNSSETSQSNDAISPRFGILYRVIPEFSLYASYSRSFNPNTGTTASGSPLEPETGEGYEVGVKADLLRSKLFATLSYFDITKQNVAVADPANFGSSVATGEQQSRGVELDITGEILPGWNIIASYAYTDAEVTKDTNLNSVGSKLPGIPRHSAGLWTTYEIQAGSLQGLGFGLGFNYVGEREGGLPNTFQVDSYFVTNAGLFYRRNNWRFGLNFKNLFDVNYIGTVSDNPVRGNDFGEPLTVIGSVTFQF
ncbi:MAG: TonB-dependent siderophore receptor [Nostoc sp.]|uniref:TonB-dependent siderophore receptor n=1 Tax=Nostoc sp. TaxID=1180 RepID=UPI002FFAE439